MRRFALTLGLSALGGACVPPLAGLVGGGGPGAILAVNGCALLGFLAAIACPRTAPLHLAALTMSAAGVNFLANCRAGLPCDPREGFWLIWAVLAAWSIGPTAAGMALGWRRRRA